MNRKLPKVEVLTKTLNQEHADAVRQVWFLDGERHFSQSF